MSKYYADGDLFEYCTNKDVDELETSELLHQLLKALNYLHDNDIVHRDIKLENVLLEDKEEGLVKLADFGFAKKLPKNSVEPLTQVMGTRIYMAPEMMKRDGYNEKADIWSLGILLYELCCLEYPFNPDWEKDEDNLQYGLMRSIVTGDFSKLEKTIPSCYSVEFRVLLKNLLNHDTKQRPNIN